MLGYFRWQHSNQSWVTALVAFVDYATVIGIASSGSVRLQADLTAAMGKHVLADVVVMFGLQKDCLDKRSSRLSACAGQLRGLLDDRPALLDGSRLSAELLHEKATEYEARADAISRFSYGAARRCARSVRDQRLDGGDFQSKRDPVRRVRSI